MPWRRTKKHNFLAKNKTTQCPGDEQNNTMPWRRTKQHNALENNKTKQCPGKEHNNRRKNNAPPKPRSCTRKNAQEGKCTGGEMHMRGNAQEGKTRCAGEKTTRENKRYAQEKNPKQECTGQNPNRNAQERIQNTIHRGKTKYITMP